MALTGRATTTIAAWRAAILSTLASEYASRVQALALCDTYDPEALADDDGNAIIETPALLLEIGPSEITTGQPTTLGPRYQGELIEWRAYHLISSRSADPELAAYEMASITRAILLAQDDKGLTGQRWGLGDAVDRPINLRTQLIELALNGHHCRVLAWQQAGLLVETYQ